MNIIRYVQFEDGEIETLKRAMQGHEHTLRDKRRSKHEEEYLPVRSLLNRVEQREPLDLTALEELRETLERLINYWLPQSKASYWRGIGTPGADDAVEGLARERGFQVGAALVARSLVRDALQAADRRPRRAELREAM